MKGRASHNASKRRIHLERRRATLELLESRLLLSTWSGGGGAADTNFFDPINW